MAGLDNHKGPYIVCLSVCHALPKVISLRNRPPEIEAQYNATGTKAHSVLLLASSHTFNSSCKDVGSTVIMRQASVSVNSALLRLPSGNYMQPNSKHDASLVSFRRESVASDARGSARGRHRNVPGISETGRCSSKLAPIHEELLSVNVPLENSHTVATGNLTRVGPQDGNHSGHTTGRNGPPLAMAVIIP